MIKEAIEFIWKRSAEASNVKFLTIDGRNYTKDEITLIKKNLPEGLIVHSLNGVIDLIDNLISKNSYAANDLLIHIIEHNRVYLFAPVLEYCGRRQILAYSKFDFPQVHFDYYHSIDEFIVMLLSLFIPTETLDKLIIFVSSLSHDQSAAYEDNGVTQKIAIKKGVTQKEQMQAPGRMKLAPFRTFTEVEQPESEFIFRIKLNSDNEPLCALFEADGGAWRLEARENIKRYFSVKSPAVSVIS